MVPAVSTYEIFYGPDRLINVAAAIPLALSLFAIRKHYRTIYGTIEIAFGAFVFGTHGDRGGAGLALTSVAGLSTFGTGR
jgi:hypothetical protein